MVRASRERGAKQAPEEDSRLTLLRDLEAPGFMPPYSAMSVQEVAKSAVQLFQLLKLMQSERDSLSEADRGTYDSVLQLYEGDAAAARRGIVGHINSALGEMRALSIASQDEAARRRGEPPDLRGQLGEELSVDLDGYLSEVQSALMQTGSEYFNEYQPMANTVTDIHLLLMPGTLGETVVAAGPAAQRIPVALPDVSSYRLISGTGGEQFYVVPPQPNDELVLLYGGEGAARDALGAYSEGVAFLRNSPNQANSDTAREIAGRMREAFASFLGTDMGNNADFQEAMRHLGEGNLAEALDDLARVSWLNGTRSALDNIYMVNVSDHAISVARIEASVVFEWGDNFQQFRNAIETMSAEEVTKQGFEPLLLYTAIGMAYDYLQLGATYQWQRVNEAGELVARGSPQRVVGEGHAATITSAWGIGSFVAGAPLETVVYCTGRYTYWDASADVEMPDGSVERVGPKDSRFAIDYVGVEFRLPGREGERDIFRLERLGAGILGHPAAEFGFEPTGARLYGETSLLYHREQGLKIQAFFSAGLSYAMDRWLLEGEVRPVDFEYQGENWRIAVGPYLGVQQDIAQDFSQAGVTRLEPGVRASFPLLPSSNVWTLSIRAGAAVEVGGPEAERMPAAPQVTVTTQMNFKLAPYEKPEETPEARLRRVRPRKAERE